MFGAHRAQERLRGEDGQPNCGGLVEQAPEGAADRSQGEPGAARQRITRARTGRRAELQQQLALLWDVRAGNEIKIIPGDSGAHPAATATAPGRADPKILTAQVAAKRWNALNAKLQRQRR